MENEPIDIVVPVWNHPVETRACLVSLIENSPSIRLVLVDNSCDRETERMLEEFAEALDVRALFLKNVVNEGFVRAVNRGLSRSVSRYVGIVRQDSIVRPGWLKPLHDFMNETADAGIVVPGYCEKGSRNALESRGMEKASADFAGLLLRRSLLDAVGNFSEDMDGGSWCLRDYSRRAWREGFRTCLVPAGVVEKSEAMNLGSALRRAQNEERIRKTFRETWGEELAYCIHFPRDSDIGCMKERFTVIVSAARQGHRILLMPHPVIAAEIERAGLHQLHEQISMHTLSRLMPERSALKAVSAFSAHGFPLIHVSWKDGACFPGGAESVSFSEFENGVIDNGRKYYPRSTLSCR